MSDTTEAHSVTLTNQEREATYRYTIRYSGAPAAYQVNPRILYDGATKPSTFVKIQGGWDPIISGVSGQDFGLGFDGSGRRTGPVEGELVLPNSNCSDNCIVRYLLQIQRWHGEEDAEPVTVEWTFTSTITGTDEQPADAHVEVTQN